MDEKIRPRPGRIAFPAAMEARFRPALAAIHDELHAREDVVALLCFGTAQRGEAKPSSDLDLCAITHGDVKWTRGSFVDGVEVQLQVGPVRMWRSMVENGHPAITTGFATGELLFDRTGEATALKERAEEVHRAGPPALTASAIDKRRYGLTNMVRDLEDLPENSPEAAILCGVMVMEALKAWCAFRRVWAERKPHVLMRRLREGDPSLAANVESFRASASATNAIAVVDAVLEMVGGRLYELTTPPEPV